MAEAEASAASLKMETRCFKNSQSMQKDVQFNDQSNGIYREFSTRLHRQKSSVQVEIGSDLYTRHLFT